MKAISNLLARLFNTASRVLASAARRLLQHGETQISFRAVRSMNLTVRGMRISYEDLNKYEKEMVDEAVKFTIRFANEYIDHHDENTQYRINANSLDEVVESHANEIMEASTRALYSTLQSEGYDLVAGKVPRVAVFQDEDYLKQLVLSVIQEVIDHIENN